MLGLSRVEDLLLFELRGPRSHEVARRVLIPVQAEGDDEEEEEEEGADPLALSALRNGRLWSNELSHLTNPAHLPEGAVLALTVMDPRHRLEKDVADSQQKDDVARRAEMRRRRRKLLQSWPEHMCHSPLWLKEVSRCMTSRAHKQGLNQVLTAHGG